MEMVLGLRRDPVFGHIVMVGLGGIFVEVLKDVAFGRVPDCAGPGAAHARRPQGPSDPARARAGSRRWIATRWPPRLSHYRDLALRHPEIDELDLNPVFAGPDGVVVVDWLMRAR